MRKINVKNIALIVGVTAFDLCVGFYDRFVNSTGIIKGILEAIHASQIGIPEFVYLPTGQIEAAMPSLSNTASLSSFGSLSFLLIVGVAFVIIMSFAGMLTSRGGMS
jgi:hypothetical protein